MNAPAKSQASRLESHIGYWLRFVSNHVSASFRKLLAATGISVTEWVVLRTLFDKAPTTHAELVQELGITKGTASKVISRLEERGLAKRRLARGRLREQVLTLTARGKKLVPELCALADQNDALFFGHLHQHDRTSLINLLRELVSHHQLKEVPIE